MSASSEQPISKSLDAWPESAEELLRALQSYVGLQERHPNIAFELILFARTLPQAVIESVLRADDRLTAAKQLYATYLDALP